MVEDRLVGTWPMTALNYRTFRVLDVAGLRAKGVRMVAAHGREMWTAHIYTTLVGHRTVLLIFLYGPGSMLDDDMVDDMIASLAPA
jgi:hypothetical protein